MKYPLCYLLLFLCLLGCQNGSKLTIEERKLPVPSCSDCAKISVRVPALLEETKLARTVNRAIEEELIYTLHFSDEDSIATAEAAADSFNRSYKKMVAEFGKFSDPWEAKIQGNVTFEDRRMLTIALASETFTGGAHGFYSKTFLNFDRESAKELAHDELFHDLEGFLQLAEQHFRNAYNIPQQATINSTGFMFPNEAFELPQSMGFTDAGLELHYSQYEVASFADGALNLTISYKEANGYLKESYQIIR